MGDRHVTGTITRGETTQKTATFEGALSATEWEQFKADIQSLVGKYPNLKVNFKD